MTEEWKPVGIGVFEASTYGRLRVPARWTDGRIRRMFPARIVHGRKVVIDDREYLVAELIARAFLGTPHGILGFIDGNEDNRAPANLEWRQLAPELDEAIQQGLSEVEDSVEVPVEPARSCKYGHAVEDWNLYGRNRCVACYKATTKIRGEGLSTSEHQRLADSIYAEMKTKNHA
ncbi:hypothetical protein [Tsukamurella soli]|uniref:HNH endonuclease n=1 Tax=Tsukamurella soli TaxID=644556 RepID=A0ABP8JJ74_9ACTN